MLIGVGVQIGKSGGQPNFATLPEQGGGETSPSTNYYLQIDGTDDYIRVPFLIGTKHIKLRMKRYEDSGYLFDMRASVNAYFLHNSTFGLNGYSVDGGATIFNYNYANLPNDRVADILITLANATTVSDVLTLFARSTLGTNTSEYLKVDIYNIVLYDTNMNEIQAFDWTTGSGTTLYSTTSASNGTIFGGTWVQV